MLKNAKNNITSSVTPEFPNKSGQLADLLLRAETQQVTLGTTK